jgi:long-chain acyl-CoA synthetase
VPISIKYPEMPVHELWGNSARKFPDRPAAVFYGARWSYSRLWGQALSLASSLRGLGVGRGDRVGLLLPNTPHFIVAYNAAHLLGAVVVAVNPLMPAREIGRELDATGCSVLIALDRLLDRLPVETPGTLVVAEAASYAPAHLRAASRLRRGGTQRPHGARRFEDLIKGPRLKDAAKVDAREDTAVIMFTSGTTGAPKGVALTHYGLVANALQSYHWLRGWGYSAKPQAAGWPVVLCAMPFFHSYGLVVMNEAVSFGCTMVLLPDPTADGIIRAVDRHRVTHLTLIPRFVREVLSHPDLARHDLTSLTTCASGGAPIPVEHMRAFERVAGTRMHQGYGLTEAGPSVCATPVEGEPNYASVGLPYPDTEIGVVDLQLGELEMGPGQVGEIRVRGPQLMKGYWGDPEATAQALRVGWLYTGDTGYLDEAGYLYVVGRKMDRILARGHAVWPTVVEEALQSHPSVELAVAFGAPDPLRCSTDVMAAVKLREGLTPTQALEDELMELCRGRLREYELPSRITFRDSIPVTPMGKVDRVAVLREIDEKIKELSEGGGGTPQRL